MKRRNHALIAVIAAISLIASPTKTQSVSEVAQEIKQLTRKVALKERTYRGLSPKKLKQYQKIKTRALDFSSKDELYEALAKKYLYYNNKYGAAVDQQFREIQSQLAKLDKEIGLQLKEEKSQITTSELTLNQVISSLGKKINTLLLKAKTLANGKDIEAYENYKLIFEGLLKKRRLITKNIDQLFKTIEQNEKNNATLEHLETPYFNSICKIRNLKKQSPNFRQDNMLLSLHSKKILTEAPTIDWEPGERSLLCGLTKLRREIFYYLNTLGLIGSTAEVYIDVEAIRLGELINPLKGWKFHSSPAYAMYQHDPKLVNQLYQY